MLATPLGSVADHCIFCAILLDSSPSLHLMPISIANLRVVNPTTSISYRLMAGSESWRITRPAPVGRVVSLVHLKATEGANPISADVIARFIAGYGIEAAIVAPNSAAFRAIVLADFIATSDRLTTAATRARMAYRDGLPGMRPRSPAMRQRFEMAYAALHDAWKAMAGAWDEGFGREDVEGLPDWLMAAWEHKGERWDQRAALTGRTAPQTQFPHHFIRRGTASRRRRWPGLGGGLAGERAFASRVRDSARRAHAADQLLATPAGRGATRRCCLRAGAGARAAAPSWMRGRVA